MNTTKVIHEFRNQKNLRGQMVHEGNTFTEENLKNMRWILATNTDKNSGLWKLQAMWNQHLHLLPSSKSPYKEQFEIFFEKLRSYYAHLENLDYPTEIQAYKCMLRDKAKHIGILYEVLSKGEFMDKCILLKDQAELDAFYELPKSSAVTWFRDKVKRAIGSGLLTSDKELRKMSTDFQKNYRIITTSESC